MILIMLAPMLSVVVDVSSNINRGNPVISMSSTPGNQIPANALSLLQDTDSFDLAGEEPFLAPLGDSYPYESSPPQFTNAEENAQATVDFASLDSTAKNSAISLASETEPSPFSTTDPDPHLHIDGCSVSHSTRARGQEFTMCFEIHNPTSIPQRIELASSLVDANWNDYGLDSNTGGVYLVPAKEQWFSPQRTFIVGYNIPLGAYDVYFGIWEVNTWGQWIRQWDSQPLHDAMVVTNAPPVALASGPSSCYTNDVVSFSSSGSYDPDGSIVSYYWDFGDGIHSTTSAPTHSYTTAGTRSVKLTVTDDCGATASSTISISVSNRPPPPPQPDLVVTSFSVVSTDWVGGWHTTITARVDNVGNAPSGCFYVSFYCNWRYSYDEYSRTYNEILLYEQEISLGTSSADSYHTFSFDTRLIPAGTWRIDVHADHKYGEDSGRVSESNEGNNWAWSVPCTWTHDSTPPTISGPLSVRYVVGTTGNTITWDAYDAYPTNYEIRVDGWQLVKTDWDGADITWPIDGLSIGWHSYVVAVTDSGGNSASNITSVYVSPPVPRLEDVFVSPDLTVLGSSVTLYYLINNPTESSAYVGLGATLYDASGFYDDECNDRELWIPTGSKWQSRTFGLSDLSPGQYGVIFGLWYQMDGSWQQVARIDIADALHILTLPDLTITNVLVSPDLVGGGSFTVSFDVINRGEWSASGFNIEVWCDYRNDPGEPTSPSPLCTFIDATIAGGGNKHFSYTTNKVGPGYHYLELHIDGMNEVVESDEANNWWWDKYWFKGSDIVLENIQWFDTYGMQFGRLVCGQPFVLSFDIRNGGDSAIDAEFSVLVLIDGCIRYECSIESMAMGQVVSFSILLTISEEGSHVFEVSVDAFDKVQEANKEGNSGAGTGESNQYSGFVGYAWLSDWTIIIYLDGDNNLDPYTVDDLEEVAQIGSNSHMSIVVLKDGASQGDTLLRFYKPGLYTGSTIIPWIYYYEEYRTTSNYQGDPLFVDWYQQEMNMACPQTLTDYVSWAANTFRAQRYALIIMDHGGGSAYSLLQDDTNASQGMSVRQMTDALSETGILLDLVGFDACLMGMVEIAFQMRDYADVFVGSEENEQGRILPIPILWEGGWPYDWILGDLRNKLQQSVAVTAIEFASIIVDRYHEYAPESTATMGAFCISGVSNYLVPALDSLAVLLQANIGEYATEIQAARDASDQYPIEGGFYVDILDLVTKIRETIPYYPVQYATQIVVDAYNAAYIDHCQKDAHPHSHGMSIYWPTAPLLYQKAYDNLDLPIMTSWDNLLWSLFWDTTHPDGTNSLPFVDILQPTDGQAINGDSWIAWLARDVNFDRVSYEVFLSPDQGMTWIGEPVFADYFYELDDLGVYGFWLDTTMYPDSSNCIVEIEYDDGWGGSGRIRSSVFEIDNLPNRTPVIEITTPVLNQVCDGTIGLGFDAVDDDYDWVYMEVFLSVDGGTTWVSAYDLFSYPLSPETTSLVLPVFTADFPDSRTCFLRIDFDDGKGGVGSILSPVFTIDNHAPSNPSDFYSYSGHSENEWSNNPVIDLLLIGASDGGGSDIYGFSVLWAQSVTDPGTTVSCLSTRITSPGLSGGHWYLNVRTVDNAGFWSSPTSFGPFLIDRLAPETGIAILGDWGASGWFSEPTWVILTASEHQSGFEALYFRLNGGNWEVVWSSTMYFLFGQGIYLLDWYSLDIAGNAESPHSIPLRIDLTSPQASLQLAGNQGIESWYRTSVTATVTATDSLSGVSSIEWNLDGSETVYYYGSVLVLTISSEGTHTLSYRVTDNAGNCGPESMVHFGIDCGSPAGPDSWNSCPSVGDWTAETGFSIVWFGASDGLAGIWGYSLEWSQEASAMPDALVDCTSSGTDAYAFMNGIWFLHVLAVDKAGNPSLVPCAIGPFMVDTEVPATSVILPTPNGENGWYTEPASVSFRWTDLSGVSETYCAIDDQAFILYSSPFLLFDDGEHALHFYSIDFSGNVETTHSISLKFDVEPPSVAEIPPAQYEAATTGHWITLQAHDDYPNCYTLALDADAPSTLTWAGDDIRWCIDGLEIGTHMYTLTVYSLSGLSAGVSVEVLVEGNTPAGTDVLVPDDMTGISLVFSYVARCGITSFIELATPPTPPCGFRIVGIAAYDISTTATYSGLVTVAIPYDDSEFASPNRELHLKLMHETLDGGWEDITTWIGTEENIVYGECLSLSEFILVEDSSPPCTSILFSGIKGLDGWYISDVLCSLIADDDLSGVWYSEYSRDNFEWEAYTGPFAVTTEGPMIIYYRSVDSAGNVEPAKQTEICIDKSAPTGPDHYYTSGCPNYWSSTETVYVEWAGASDERSGVYGYSYGWSHSMDTLPDQTIDTLSTTLIATLDSGIWYLHIRTSDGAGNWADNAYHIGPFKIDRDSPTTSMRIEGPVGMNGWYLGAVQVTASAEDSLCGVDYIMYSLDDGPWLVYNGPFSVSGDQVHEVGVKAVDYANNWCNEEYTEFVVDTTPPMTSQTVTGTTNPNGEYLNTATIVLTVEDNLNLYAYTDYRVDSGLWRRYTGPFTVQTDGHHWIDFFSVDYAGNSEAIRRIELDVKEVGFFYDDFTSASTGYDPRYWTQETWGTGQFYWDGTTIYGLTASGHGHRTLVSTELFQPDVRVIIKGRMTNYASWEPAVCFGWTDRVTSDWNYHFLDGQNGVWLELNWPQQDYFMLYSKRSGAMSEQRVYVDFTQYHEYELRWTTGAVVLYIDGSVYQRIVSNVPNGPLRYKMTVTAWSGNTPNEWLYVDYVDIGPIPTIPDGKILAIGDNQGKVRMFRVNGLNPLVLLWTKQLSGTLVQKVLLSDLDQDGKNEVLACTDAGVFYCLDSVTGDVIWQWSQGWSGFTHWAGIFVAELDGDGYLEIVTAVNARTTTGGGVIVLEHTGAVKTIRVSPITGGHNGNGPDEIELADFNGDGVDDIACLYGSHLYSGTQPMIEVVDVSAGGATVLWNFRYGGFSGSGMTNFELAQLDGDNVPDYITAGWWCPVTAFRSHGQLIWTNAASGGNADKVALYSANMNGLGTAGLAVGTGAYSNTGSLYMYFVDPFTGATLATIPLGIVASDFRPWTIANIDGDPALEIIASCNVVGSASDRLIVLDGSSRSISWYTTIEYVSQFFLPYDLDGDLLSEILAPDGNGISLFDGYGNKLWNIPIGAIAYTQSIAQIRTEAAPQPPTPELQDLAEEDVDGEFSLNWLVDYGSGTAISHYEIQVSDTSDFSRIRGVWYPEDDRTSQPVTFLMPDEYFFRMRAVGVDGQLGEWSNVESILVTRDNTVPLIDSPDNAFYEEHSSGHSVTWSPYDARPDHYVVYRDGYTVQSGSWAGGTIAVTTDGLVTGNYSLTAVVYDEFNNWQADTLFITVLANEAPFAEDATVTYEAGTTGHIILWEPYDYTPISYEFWFHSVLLESGSWDGAAIQLTVDGLDPGFHEFTLVLYDGTGLSSSVLGMVHVVDTVSPAITAPEDRTVEAGSSGTVLTWTAIELYPASFILSLGGVLIASGSWDGTPVSFTVDYPSVGVHEYIMAFVDQSGNLASASVSLTVVDTTRPMIIGPSIVRYEAGSTGNEIAWIPSDLHPAYQIIHLDGVIIRSGPWDGSPITVSIDGYDSGVYTYILTCLDLYSNMASHTAIVIVDDTTPPVIVGPADLTYEAGVMGHALSWSFLDLYPDSYSVLRDGVEIASGAWTGLEVIIGVDLLNPGLYSYTFVALDSYDNSAVDTAWVTVLGNTPTGTDVEVPDSETGVVLTFDETTSPGTTSVDITDSGPHPPDNFRLMGLYYNIATTANYEGSIVVAIPYDESLVRGLEKNLRLWHWKETAGWEDVTVFVDEVNNIVYGQVTSLSLFAVMEDSGPPVTTITLNGVSGSNGWYVSNVTVDLTSCDDVSEIAAIAYSLDGVTWIRYCAPFQIIREGTTTVWFNSTDVANNAEATRSVEVRIDKSTPSTELVMGMPSVIRDAVYVNSTTLLTLVAADLVSGPCSVSYRIDGGAWQQYTVRFWLAGSDGIHTIEYYCVDMAGNLETLGFSSLILDNSGPSTLLTCEAPFYVNHVTSTTPLTLSASDTGSGICAVFYQIDGLGYQAYSVPFSVVGVDGRHLVQFYSVDLLGNIEAPSEQLLILDNHGPISESGLEGTQGENGWFVSAVVVSLESDDGAGAGVSTIYYVLDSDPMTIYCGAFEVSGDGYHTVQFWAEDNLGNPEDPTRVCTFRTDTCAPVSETCLSPSIPNGFGQWYVTPVVVTIQAGDAMSSVAGVYYSVNDGITQSYTGPLEVLGEGYFVLKFWSRDYAGNWECPSEVSFKIDRTMPLTSLTIGDPKHGEEPVYVSDYTAFSLASYDSVSGAAMTEYRVDGAAWAPYVAPFCIGINGQHIVYYRGIDIAGNTEAEHSVIIVVNASQLRYIGETSGIYSDPATLQAALIDIATQQPVCGKQIVFAIGIQSASSVTDSSGIAIAIVVLTQPAGTYMVTAVYSPDSGHLGASDSREFTIGHETAVVTYTGATVVPTTASTITLRATLTDEDDAYWGDMSLISVTFFIYSVPIDLSKPVAVVGPIVVGPGSLPGVGVAVVAIPLLPENGYVVLVKLQTEHNPYFETHPSDLVSLTVYVPTGDFVTGGGWIVDPSGGKGNFGFNVQYRKSGLPRGQSIYVYRVGEWEVIVKSNAWTGMAIDGNHAFFEGKCVVQRFNSATGELVWAEGNYQFRVDVWDNDESGGIDVYQIRVLDKNGLTYHEAGVNPMGYLQGGNIIIHLAKTKA